VILTLDPPGLEIYTQDIFDDPSGNATLRAALRKGLTPPGRAFARPDYLALANPAGSG
jgi:hypothetical protein